MKTSLIIRIAFTFICFVGITKAATTVTNKIITSWYKTSGTGYGGFQNQVLNVKYDSSSVYVHTNSIPAYSIGPWDNPNYPSAKNYYFKFPLNATAKSGTKVSQSLGAIGLWIDGTIIYNGWDGYSYNNLGVWQRNANFWEGSSFDNCLGHPDVNGIYHNHINPKCMYTTSSSSHSPLIGYMFDGYPIYGPYGYSSPNSSTSGIKRIVSGYSLRSISARTSLSNGTNLAETYYGPTINSTYPLGAYLQDYVHSSSTGDLDAYNGRWCVTPEYPSGTYAYFVTLDSSLANAFPYVVGTSFYGTPATYPQLSGVTVPSSGVTTYF